MLTFKEVDWWLFWWIVVVRLVGGPWSVNWWSLTTRPRLSGRSVVRRNEGCEEWTGRDVKTGNSRGRGAVGRTLT